MSLYAMSCSLWQNISNNLSKFSGLVRKSIARVLTVMNQTARQTIAVHLQGKKYLPLDMRAKKTRAIRRRLTAEEAGAKTLKQIKKDRHFPARKYVEDDLHFLRYSCQRSARDQHRATCDTVARDQQSCL